MYVEPALHFYLDIFSDAFSCINFIKHRISTCYKGEDLYFCKALAYVVEAEKEKHIMDFHCVIVTVCC